VSLLYFFEYGSMASCVNVFIRMLLTIHEGFGKSPIRLKENEKLMQRGGDCVEKIYIILSVYWRCYLLALCPRTRLDRELITGLAAIMAQVAITDQAAIMGTAGTTGMAIRLASVLGSSQDGADGDQGGGVPRPTPIIPTTRTIQRPLLLFRSSPKRMFSGTSRNPIIGTTVRIPRATTPTLTPARADG
jgi:hypothetical protein